MPSGRRFLREMPCRAGGRPLIIDNRGNRVVADQIGRECTHARHPIRIHLFAVIGNSSQRHHWRFTR